MSTHAHRLPRFQTLNGLWDLMAKRSCYAVAPILLLLEWAMQGRRDANRRQVALMCHGPIESTFIPLRTAMETKADAV